MMLTQKATLNPSESSVKCGLRHYLNEKDDCCDPAAACGFMLPWRTVVNEQQWSVRCAGCVLPF